MNRHIYLWAFICYFFTACNADVGSFDLGYDLVDVKSQVVLVDTFSIDLSTVKIDSLPTSGPKQAMVGKYENDNIGSAEFLDYFNVDMASNLSKIYSDNESDTFDSLTVRLNYSNYYIGDTTQTMSFSLYRLTKRLELEKNSANEEYLYNTSSFPYDETPLGSVRFRARPLQYDTLEFRLSDDIGKEIIKMVKTKATEIENNDNFNEYLRGFVLKTNSGSGNLVLGFTPDSIRLKLYTHRSLQIKDNREYEFMLASEGTNYNQVIADRSNGYFSALSVQKEKIPSIETNNMSYIQGTAGIVTRIDFPTLNQSFFENMSLFKAEVVFYIPKKTISEIEYDVLPSSLQFYTTSSPNEFVDNLTTTSGGQTVSVTATLNYQQGIDEGSYYAADITDWLLDETSENYYNTNHGLLLTLPLTNLKGNADVVILNGQKQSEYKPKLNLFYLKYDE